MAEAALDEIARAARERREYSGLLDSAAALGPPVLKALVRRLDSSDPLLFSALGRLVAHYPSRSQAEDALLRAASSPRSSDNRRMAAILLLYELGFPPMSAAELLSALDNPSASIANMLAHTLAARDNTPGVLHEYNIHIMALLSLPADLLYSAFSSLAASSDDGAVAVLRLLALYPHPDLMDGAITALTLRLSETRIKALVALEPNLPPEHALVVSRALQKARLLGNPAALAPSAPDDRYRALLSAIDTNGSRSLWFQVPSASDNTATEVVGLSLNDISGLSAVASRATFHLRPFPPPSQSGRIHLSLLKSGPDVDLALAHASCLEVPFIYGLRVLRDAVKRNWNAGAPLPMQYLLLYHLIWQHGALEDINITDLKDIAKDIAIEETDTYADAQVELLHIPEISSWYLQSAGTRLFADEITKAPGTLLSRQGEESWYVLLSPLVPSLIRLAHDDFDHKLCVLYARRLTSMSEWLRYAGREREAMLAASAAHTMRQSPPEANPFVLQLVQRGILIALNHPDAPHH